MFSVQDLLNQPVALFLIQEVARSGVSQPVQGPQLSPVYSYDSNRKLLDVICNQTKFRDEDRFIIFLSSYVLDVL